MTLTRPLPCCKSKSLSMLSNPSVFRAPCLPSRPTPEPSPSTEFHLFATSFHKIQTSKLFLSRFRHDARRPRGNSVFIPCSGRQRWLFKIRSATNSPTILTATGDPNSPVFFLPKHCTLGTEAMVNEWPLSVSIGEGVCCRGRWKRVDREFPHSSDSPELRWCGLRLGCTNPNMVRSIDGLGLNHVLESCIT